MTSVNSAAWRIPAALMSVAVGASLAMPSPLEAQEPVTRYACYVPGTGTVYLIREAGTKQSCTAPAHVEFSFVDGAGALRAGDAVAGDLSGTIGAPLVTGLRGRVVSAAAPADAQVLTWDAAAGEWLPKTPTGGTAGDHGSLAGLTDDDHPQYLLATGHRQSNGGFAISGTFGVGTIPVQGAGGRLMYSTTANAFRVGSVSAPFADAWDLPNLGAGSIALGHNVRAQGNNSIVLGQNTFAGPGASGSFVFATNTSPFNLIGTEVAKQFFVHAEGGIVLSTALGSSCQLRPGAGSLECSSDAAGKTAFADVDAEVVLDALAAMPITRWRYAGEPDHVRHMGPTAQDFRAAFGLGTDDRHIGVLDAAGVSLAASKALIARTNALAAENAELRNDVRALHDELDLLRATLQDAIARMADPDAAASGQTGR